MIVVHIELWYERSNKVLKLSLTASAIDFDKLCCSFDFLEGLIKLARLFATRKWGSDFVSTPFKPKPVK